MSWTDSSNDGGEKLGDGLHDVEIMRVYYAKKDGTPYASQSGDPKVRVQFRDAGGKMVTVMFTLSDKASFFWRQICKFTGMDMEQLKSDKVEIADFADPAFGDKNLLGRRLKIRVSDWDGDWPNALAVDYADPIEDGPIVPDEDVPF